MLARHEDPAVADAQYVVLSSLVGAQSLIAGDLVAIAEQGSADANQAAANLARSRALAAIP